jgi:hypothetical protein
MPAFRSLVSVLVSFVGRSFSTNSRPALRAAACGGRPRPAKPALGLDAAEAYMGLLLMKLQPYLVWLVVPSGFWRV